jgi:GntR family transcriptional regulator
LYYQLQEILKEKIESGEWAPGDALPPEKALAAQYGVSRVCVRHALAILEDDREILRVQGRGTFVAQRKLSHRPCGLTGLHVDGTVPTATVRILDQQLGGAERTISTALSTPADEIIRITALWSISATPAAIGQHFFARDDAALLGLSEIESRAVSPWPVDGLRLGGASISLETTQCGQFEADLLGIPYRATLLLTLAVIHAAAHTEPRPFEVVRLGYRGDIVQLNLDTTPPASMEPPGG